MAEHTDSLADAVDEFLRRTYDDDRRRLLSAEDPWAALVGPLAELGVFAVALTEEQGGLDLSPAALGPIFAHYGRHLVPGPLLENSLLPALLYDAVPREAQKLLADVVERGAPIAFVDPGVSEHWSDQLGSVTTKDGLLHGSFTAVRFAAEAKLLVVVADDGEQPQLWLVEKGTPGLTVEPLTSADPLSAFARVRFEAVEGIPVNDQVDVPGLLRRIRQWSRALIAYELSGIAGRCVELSVAYAAQREQFGRPIGSFQAVKHILADMHTRAAALRNLCEATVSSLGEADADSAEVDCAALKAFAATVSVSVCEDAIQVHGGIGFTAEADIHWYYKRTLALRSWYGDALELEERIGTLVLDAPAPIDTARK